ncbi:APC family permease [Rhodococcus sp. A14]|uniref:amino acid permease n=1 Tax=Rhodococcus sp. A14 TaxID=1194106 RepID=UPI001421807C|nr:amino acid permease [Rhodococcus sp. A14]
MSTQPLKANNGPADDQEVGSYGYEQELNRGLSFWTTWAIGFAFVSPIVGLYTIFGLGMETAGPAWLWAIPIVAVGQLTLAIVYSQLAARWPIAGGIYQWTRRLIGPAAGWWAGWVYMWAIILIVAGVVYSGGQFVGELLGLHDRTPGTNIALAIGVLAVVTAINCIGLNVLKYAVVVGIASEVVGSVAVAIALLLRDHQQPISIIADTSLTPGGSGHFATAFVAAIAIGGWAFLGFDACGSVAEETLDPRREVPRAILFALPPVIAVQLLTAVSILLSTPDLPAVIGGFVADPVGNSVVSGLGDWAAKPFLVIVVFGFTACALAVQATASRVVFAFSRDRMIPGAGVLRRVSRRNHVPVFATLAVGGLAALAFIYSNALDVLVRFSTGAYFLAFLFPVAAFLYVRIRGRWQPHPTAPFKGRIGYAVTVIAFFWAVFEGINIAWPRTASTLASTWAVPAGLAVFATVGAVYFMWKRPDQQPLASENEEASEALHTPSMRDEPVVSG